MSLNQELREALGVDVPQEAEVVAEQEEVLADAPQVEEESTPEEVDALEQDTGVDDEPQSSQSLNALLDSDDVDKEWFYNNHTVTIAGHGDDRKEIPLGDAINQLQDVERREAQIKQREEAVNAEIRKRAQAQPQVGMTPELQAAYGHLSALESQYNSIEQSQEMDPGEKANAKLQIGTAYKQAQQHIEQVQQQAQVQQQQSYSEAMQRRNQVIVDQIPEWKDPKVMSTESEAIYALAGKFGITPDEINRATDPRAILLMREFAKLGDKQEAANKAVKKVRRMPKMTRTDSRTKPSARLNVDALKKRASATGEKRDMHAAMMAEAKLSGLI